MQMGKLQISQTRATQNLRPASSARQPTSESSRMKARQTEKIREIRAALIAAGFLGLAAQATALGLARSTAWTVLKAHHKSSGLSATIISRMLLSPLLPQNVRNVIEEYVELKCSGAFGHNPDKVHAFRNRLKLACDDARPP